MFCKECGREIPESSKVCMYCGVPVGTGGKFCPKCGAAAIEGSAFCQQCGQKLDEPAQQQTYQQQTYQQQTYQQQTYQQPVYQQPVYQQPADPNLKSKMAAGILGILLGSLGVHNFYLGYTGKAIAQLLITLLSCGILALASGIWGIVEGVMILTGSINTDGKGLPLRD